METLEEFKIRVKKANTSKKGHYKITNSYGVYDYYKYYRKIRPKEREYAITDSQYYSILRKVNDLLAKDIAWCREVRLPHGMGSIEARKRPRRITLDEEGRPKTNLAIDWNRTLELWYADKEAHEKKTLLRINADEIYKVYYDKSNNAIVNKSFFDFIFSRDIKRRLKYNIKAGLVDALEFNTY